MEYGLILCKKSSELRSLVAIELHRRGEDPNINWRLASVCYQNKDPEFSRFLNGAILFSSTIKRRNSFRVIKW